MRARQISLFVLGLLLPAALATCGPGARNTDGDCTGVCTSLGYQQCQEDGTFDAPVQCGVGEVCDPTRGCVVCVPDSLYCFGPTGNDVYRCNDEGTGGELVEACGADEACSNGGCKTPCEAALDHPSNVGCDFWAADLDNEASNLPSSNAAAQQFAIVAANNNDYPVTVTVTKNAARVGQPINEQVVTTVSIPPRVAQRIDLPQREVDGAMGQNAAYTRNGGSGTFVSPHAYHVVTSGPVVVYQFNPIVQQFSNDASTLIPIQALGTDYIAVGFQTANPCGIDGLTVEGVPDHGAITIIATQEDTHVTVTTSHAIMPSGGDSGLAIPATPKGGAVSFTLGRYAVANLETAQYVGSAPGCAAAVNAGQNGDFTGTYIKSDKPVVVFTASERGLGFGGADNVEYPPDWVMGEDKICCTDHLEEQLLPVTALGREFAIARSPIRSTYTSWIEQDIIRVVGSADGTVVTTNLPAPYDTFTLDARQQKTFMARTGFTMSADKAIQVAQYLVPQHFIKQGFTGDPSQLIIPAAEQHRKDYVFLVPTTFQKNYAVFAKPVAGANIKVDGMLLDGAELSSCTRAPIGMVAGVDYEQVTCLLAEGRHQATGDLPFGLSVYGYYSVGSYAFVGGSDVKLINPIL
ncbi:MAG: IgGFc-binding protein [Myxococcota bacterium]|nr:IgGFc-binding protein [Myxococcota bacterium]